MMYGIISYQKKGESFMELTLTNVDCEDIVDGKLVIPEGVVNIDSYICSLNCGSDVEELVLPSTIKFIDEFAFDNLENLKSIIFNFSFDDYNGIEYYYPNVFAQNAKVTHINGYNVGSVNVDYNDSHPDYMELMRKMWHHKQRIELKESFLDSGLDEIATKGYVEIHKDGFVKRFTSPDAFIKHVELGGNNTINRILKDTYLERLEKHRAENKYRAYLEEQMSK